MRNVLNTLEALQAISERQPIGVGELARLLSLPKSTVQRCLVTLSEAGWIRSTEGEMTRWVLTTKPLVVGIRASNPSGLKDAALPIMQRLRSRVNETTNLTTYEGSFAVLVERLDSTHSVRTFSPLGVRAPLHATAAGRAILSHLPDAALEEALAGPLARYNEHTLTERERVLDEVMVARRRGFSVAHGEWNDGVVAVASAIVVAPDRDLFKRPGGILGTIGVSGPAFRMTETRSIELGLLVSEAARDIADSLGGRAIVGSPRRDIGAPHEPAVTRC